MHPKTILQHYNIQPKKSLGQNFLFDEHVLRRIVAAGGVTGRDQVLEIGPGLGALTAVLAQTAVSVTAVELDQRFFPILKAQLAPFDNVRLIHGDILEQNPSDLFRQPYKVVANVPYYITGAILRHLLSAEQKPTCLVMTVQKEVAERITAVSPKMSLLAVSVQYYGQATMVDTVKAGAFWPRPKVDSAVIRFDLTSDDAFADEKTFFRIAKAGFSQKRKQLKNNLRQLGLPAQKVARLLEGAGIDGQRRAQTLTIPEWQQLTRTFKNL